MKICKADGCDRTDIKGLGLCHKHYSRWMRNGDLEPRQRMDGYRLQHPELYKAWTQMKSRCNSNDPKIRPHYKDKGIKICDRWLGLYGFQHFVEDMGDKPSYERTNRNMPLWTLDRIDSTKNYCPENCRWANWREQASNRNICNTVPGVCWKAGEHRWKAYMTIGGRKLTATFRTYEEAVAQRHEWEQENPL